MKKLLIALSLGITLLLAATPSAFAGIYICGYGTVDYIVIYESDPGDVPVNPCDVWVTVEVCPPDDPDCTAPEIFSIYAEAYGTQLNLALLKALNYEERISMCLYLYFDKKGYHARITYIDFGDDPPPPPPPGS